MRVWCAFWRACAHVRCLCGKKNKTKTTHNTQPNTKQKTKHKTKTTTLKNKPYNYYEFGQRYVGSLIDWSRSVLGAPDRWAGIAAQLAAGENVVLLANHQTEADPGVFAHMLAAAHPSMATDVIYVAGDRVVTDPLCKPFSMGRNLFCVHSKKRLDDVPGESRGDWGAAAPASFFACLTTNNPRITQQPTN